MQMGHTAMAGSAEAVPARVFTGPWVEALAVADLRQEAERYGLQAASAVDVSSRGRDSTRSAQNGEMDKLGSHPERSTRARCIVRSPTSLPTCLATACEIAEMLGREKSRWSPWTRVARSTTPA